MTASQTPVGDAKVGAKRARHAMSQFGQVPDTILEQIAKVAKDTPESLEHVSRWKLRKFRGGA